MSKADQALTISVDNTTTSRRSILSVLSALAAGLCLPCGRAAQSATAQKHMTAANTADGENWPEFAQWLADAIALDAYYAETSRLNGSLSDEARHEREDTQSDEMERLCDLALEISARPAHTERQIAILTTLAVFGLDKSSGSKGSFDLTSIGTPEDDIAETTSARLVIALARRAAVVLPDVPFIFSVEG